MKGCIEDSWVVLQRIGYRRPWRVSRPCPIFIFFTNLIWEQTVGIEPTFLAWQANILTVILCLLKLGYMANLPRYYFSTLPGRTYFSYRVQLAACSPYRRIGLRPITPYLHITYWIRSIVSIKTQPEKGQPHVGIEPTYLAWKASILADKLIGQI